MPDRDPVVGRLAGVIRAALKDRAELVASGASACEVAAAFERVVRDAWPKGREKSWTYLCDRCNDTGTQMFVCRPGMRCDGISTRLDGPKDKPGKYTRLCAKGPSDYEHDYGVPCSCAAGVRFQPKHQREVDFTTATKSKPRTPTRFGR